LADVVATETIDVVTTIDVVSTDVVSTDDVSTVEELVTIDVEELVTIDVVTIDVVSTEAKDTIDVVSTVVVVLLGVRHRTPGHDREKEIRLPATSHDHRVGGRRHERPVSHVLNAVRWSVASGPDQPWLWSARP